MSNVTPPRDGPGPSMSQYSPVVSQRRSGARGSQQLADVSASSGAPLGQAGDDDNNNLRESMAQVTESMKGRLGGGGGGVGGTVQAPSLATGSSRVGFATLDPQQTAQLKKAEAEQSFVQSFEPYIKEAASGGAGGGGGGGRYLIINILSNWGDAAYVGLGGISVFDSQGERIPLTVAQLSYLAPEEENPAAAAGLGGGAGPGGLHTMSVANFFSTTDPRQRLGSLLNTDQAGGVGGSRGDETRMWLTEYSGIGAHHILCIELPTGITGVSAVALQNYKKGRVHSLRGARHVEMTLDDELLFRGEVRCGQMEPVLLTDDTATLRKVASVLFPRPGGAAQQHHQSIPAATPPPSLTVESQAGSTVLSAEGTFPCSGIEVGVLTTWCHPPRALGLQALRLYNEHRQLINTFDATVTVVNADEEVEAIPVETATLLRGDINPTTGLPQGPAIFVPLYCPLPPTAAEQEAAAKSGQGRMPSLSHPTDDPTDLPPLNLAKIRVDFPEGVTHRLSTIEVVNAKVVETEVEESEGITETRFVDHFGLKEVRVNLLTRSTLHPSVAITPGEGMTIRKANPTGGVSCNKAQCFDISNLSDVSLAAQSGGGGGDVLTQSVMISSAIKTKVAIRRHRLGQLSSLQSDATAWQMEHHRYQPTILPLVYVVTISLQFSKTGTPPDASSMAGWAFTLSDEEWAPIPTATSSTGAGGGATTPNRLEPWIVTASSSAFTAVSSVVMEVPTALSMISLYNHHAAGGGGGFAPVLEAIHIHGDDGMLYIRERADEYDDLPGWIYRSTTTAAGLVDYQRGLIFFSPEVPANKLPLNLC